MSTVQNNGRTTGGITGMGGRPGRSGNPGGGPKGFAKARRTLVGEDGMRWWSIASDPLRRDSDRLEASRLLADRGWSKPANFEPLEGNPLGLEDVEAAGEEFRPRSWRLADDPESDRA
jgi:hypothetical protein